MSDIIKLCKMSNRRITVFRARIICGTFRYTMPLAVTIEPENLEQLRALIRNNACAQAVYLCYEQEC